MIIASFFSVKSLDYLSSYSSLTILRPFYISFSSFWALLCIFSAESCSICLVFKVSRSVLNLLITAWDYLIVFFWFDSESNNFLECKLICWSKFFFIWWHFVSLSLPRAARTSICFCRLSITAHFSFLRPSYLSSCLFISVTLWHKTWLEASDYSKAILNPLSFSLYCDLVSATLIFYCSSCLWRDFKSSALLEIREFI